VEKKYSFLTDSIVVRSNHNYKHPSPATPALYSDIKEFNSHAENLSYHLLLGTVTSFMSHHIYYMLTNAPCADHYCVHKINPDSQLKCEEPATVNVYRVECSLSYAE